MVIPTAMLAVCGAVQAQMQMPGQSNVRPMGDRQTQTRPGQQQAAPNQQRQLSGARTPNLEQARRFTTGSISHKLPIQGNPTYEKVVDGHKVKTRVILSPMSAIKGRSAESGVRREETGTTHEGGLVCKNANVTVSLADDSFKSVAQSGQATRLQPGLVYDFDSFFSGRMAPATAPRNPVRLALTNVAGMKLENREGTGPASYLDVEKPDITTLGEGVLQLRNRLPRNGNKQSASFDIQELHSGAEALLALSASAAAYGVKVSAAYDSNSKEEDRQILIDATQEMFTLTAQPLADGIFVNAADGKTGDKIMLGNVTYGHRVLLAIKTQTRESSKLASATASYANFIVEAAASVASGNRTFSSNTSIRMFDVGNVSMAPPTRIDQVDAWLKKYFATANLQNAQPIRYQFVNMNNDFVRSESATDKVPVRNCVQENMTLKVKLEEIRNINAREHQVNAGEEGASVGAGNRDEVVKFGTRQTVHAVVGGKDVHDARGRTHHSICWWDEGNDKCLPAREFNGRVFVTDSERAFPIKASQVSDRDFINIHTAYIAMYRTKAGGNTNGKQNPQPADKVFINDVIAAGSKGMPWYVQVPWNGRVFEYKYKLWTE